MTSFTAPSKPKQHVYYPLDIVLGNKNPYKLICFDMHAVSGLLPPNVKNTPWGVYKKDIAGFNQFYHIIPSWEINDGKTIKKLIKKEEVDTVFAIQKTFNAYVVVESSNQLPIGSKKELLEYIKNPSSLYILPQDNKWKDKK